MKNLIFTFVAFLRAAADFIQENSGSAEAAATPNGDGSPEPEKKKRGPKPKAAEPTPEPATTEPVEVTTYSVEELKTICDPLIKAGGAETEFLREQIKAHGGTAISKIPVENHAAFVDAVQPRVLALPKGEEFE